MTIGIDQLGAELRRQRAERDLNLREVERETGISAATLSRIERGSGTPDVQIIEKLAEWLGTSVRTGGEAMSEVKTDADLKRVIAVHLRANKKLPEAVAHAIAETFAVVVSIETKKAQAAARGHR